MNERKLAEDLMLYLDRGKSMYHSAAESVARLEKAGFKRVNMDEVWKLKRGEGYYTLINDSGLVAFRLGKKDIKDTGFKMIGAHLDSPCFRIKPNPVIEDNGILKLNTEVYGGVILSTWFDRPLSIAGRVMVNRKGKVTSEFVDFEKPIAIMPNAAIHMNREVNEGFKYLNNKHTLPILLMEGDKEVFKERLVELLKVKKEDILSEDLYLYDTTKAVFMGEDDEYISAGRLDNLAMSHVAIQTIIDSKNREETLFIVVSDNEEVGSRSIQGAYSQLIPTVLKRIILAEGASEEDYHVALAKSFMLSADMAHAYHTNFSDTADPTNKCFINKGPCVKEAASKGYITDGFSNAKFKALCKKAKVNCQDYVNPSHIRGGSTIGPITESVVQVKAVDIGNPVLAMHSVRELGGTKDHYDMYKVLMEYFKEA